MNETRDSLGLLIHDAARLLRRRFEERTGGYGLSAAQWRLLVILKREGAAPQARLAEMLEIEPISVSRLIDRMEQGGWIVRKPLENDRRVRMIYPTQKSRDIFTEVKASASEVYDEAMAGLDREQRRALIDGLAAIVANLSGTPAAEEKEKESVRA